MYMADKKNKRTIFGVNKYAYKFNNRLVTNELLCTIQRYKQNGMDG